MAAVVLWGIACLVGCFLSPSTFTYLHIAIRFTLFISLGKRPHSFLTRLYDASLTPSHETKHFYQSCLAGWRYSTRSGRNTLVDWPYNRDFFPYSYESPSDISRRTASNREKRSYGETPSIQCTSWIKCPASYNSGNEHSDRHIRNLLEGRRGS